jgi:hypothetical protein
MGFDMLPKITPALVFGLFAVILRNIILRNVPGGESQFADLIFGQHKEQGSPWHGLNGPLAALISCWAGPLRRTTVAG